MSSLKSNNEEKAYRIYVTDALMAIADNTTHFLGAQGVVDFGKNMTKRWIEIFDPPPKEEPVDNRPSEEIASDMWRRIRGH